MVEYNNLSSVFMAEKEKKSKIVAVILALLIGGLGIHRFYLGQTKKGILYLVFCWTGLPSILALVDGVRYLLLSDEEFSKKYD